MFLTIWNIIKGVLAWCYRNGEVLSAVVITAIIVAFCTWHIKPDAPTSTTTVTVDTAAIVSRAVDSTSRAMTARYESQVTYWRHRYITKPGSDGKPETVVVVDSGGYNQSDFWEYLYEETRSQYDSMKAVWAQHKCETAPAAPGRTWHIGAIVGHSASIPGLKDHETQATGLIQYHKLLLAPQVEYRWRGEEKFRAGAGIGAIW